MAPFTHEEQRAPTHDQDLSTLLSEDQRCELTRLIAQIAEGMRKHITLTFDAPITSKPQFFKGKGPNVDGSNPNQQTSEEEKVRKLSEQREKDQPKQEELKKAALDFLQKWRDSVIARVEEVMSPRESAQQVIEKAKVDGPIPNTGPPPDNKIISPETNVEDSDAALIQLYPPTSTSLYSLPKEKRVLVLHSMLLLLLSLEHYVAHSRILLLNISSSLHLPLHILAEHEVSVAQGLVEGAHHMSGNEATKHRSEENRNARRWKVGLAGVAGAALIGVTGGLAAPLVAVGIGSVMGGLGLGASAVAGLLGTLAESGLVVGALFGENNPLTNSFLLLQNIYAG